MVSTISSPVSYVGVNSIRLRVCSSHVTARRLPVPTVAGDSQFRIRIFTRKIHKSSSDSIDTTSCERQLYLRVGDLTYSLRSESVYKPLKRIEYAFIYITGLTIGPNIIRHTQPMRAA